MTRYWKSSFRSLDPNLDEDHRTLFKLLDRVSTLRRESDVEDLNPQIDKLIEHTLDHFAREERVMKHTNYPRMHQHANAHLDLRYAFIESLRQVAKGKMTIPGFVGHLKASFTYHFEAEDMTFVTWQLENHNRASTQAQVLGGSRDQRFMVRQVEAPGVPADQGPWQRVSE